MRKVLLLARHRDPAMIECLSAAGWLVAHASSLAAAARLLDAGDIAAGLIDLSTGCTPQQLHALEALIMRTVAVWVALIDAQQASDWPVRRFVLDHCFDFVTQAQPGGALLYALGHANAAFGTHGAGTLPEGVMGRHGMIGRCAAMLQLYRGIDGCARSGAPVLISGEPGTGKELAARAIHDRSARFDRPQLTIHCAATHPDMLQTVLFGDERSDIAAAYPARRPGRVRSIDGGTVFLREVSELSSHSQAVLLRFIEESAVDDMMGQRDDGSSVRLLSASSIDLGTAVHAKRFRADLLERLSVLQVSVPPLRERDGDVRLLAAFALSQARHEGTQPVRGFAPTALEAMEEYPWPGNVRELIQRVHRAVTMTGARALSIADLCLPQATDVPGLTLAEIRASAERKGIRVALERHRYNLAGAAEELGISRATLYRLLHDLDLPTSSGSRGRTAHSPEDIH